MADDGNKAEYMRDETRLLKVATITLDRSECTQQQAQTLDYLINLISSGDLDTTPGMRVLPFMELAATQLDDLQQFQKLRITSPLLSGEYTILKCDISVTLIFKITLDGLDENAYSIRMFPGDALLVDTPTSTTEGFFDNFNRVSTVIGSQNYEIISNEA